MFYACHNLVLEYGRKYPQIDYLLLVEFDVVYWITEWSSYFIGSVELYINSEEMEASCLKRGCSIIQVVFHGSLSTVKKRSLVLPFQQNNQAHIEKEETLKKEKASASASACFSVSLT